MRWKYQWYIMRILPLTVCSMFTTKFSTMWIHHWAMCSVTCHQAVCNMTYHQVVCSVILPPCCVQCNGANVKVSLCDHLYDLNFKPDWHVYKVYHISDIMVVICFHQTSRMPFYIIKHKLSGMTLIMELGKWCQVNQMCI